MNRKPMFDNPSLNALWESDDAHDRYLAKCMFFNEYKDIGTRKNMVFEWLVSVLELDSPLFFGFGFDSYFHNGYCKAKKVGCTAYSKWNVGFDVDMTVGGVDSFLFKFQKKRKS